VRAISPSTFEFDANGLGPFDDNPFIRDGWACHITHEFFEPFAFMRFSRSFSMRPQEVPLRETEYPPAETQAVLLDLKFCSDGHSDVCVFSRFFNQGWRDHCLKVANLQREASGKSAIGNFER